MEGEMYKASKPDLGMPLLTSRKMSELTIHMKTIH